MKIFRLPNKKIVDIRCCTNHPKMFGIVKLQNLLHFLDNDVFMSCTVLFTVYDMKVNQISLKLIVSFTGKVIFNQESEQSAASVVAADIPTTNGVIHVIDHVLLPSQKHYVLV